MAHESSAPNIKTILIGAVVAVMVLGILDLVLKSYFIAMYEDEEQRKVLHLPTTQLNKLRDAEHQRLISGPTPIDKAMKDLAARGLDNGSPRKVNGVDMTPEPSSDRAAMVGWTLLGREAGAAPASVGTDADGGTAIGDGGAPLATDARALAAGDAGALAPLVPAPHGGGAH